MAFAENNVFGTVFMTAPNIDTVHGFTTRYGGVSEGIFESLNLGENRGDERESVAENYRRIKNALGIEGNLVFSRQVHGTEVRVVGKGDTRELFTPIDYEADGLITNEADVPLIIFTADCVPVLLYDGVVGAVGAVHAGWRGASADICGVAVRKMATEFGCDARNIRAAIGPSIGPCCYETDAEVTEKAAEILGGIEKFARPAANGKYMTDLWEMVKLTLLKAGVPEENISLAGECTKCNHEKYWSHRYTNGQRGSQASIIMLKRKPET